MGPRTPPELVEARLELLALRLAVQLLRWSLSRPVLVRRDRRFMLRRTFPGRRAR